MAAGWTGTTVPVNFVASRLCRISDPILLRSRLAPTTATTRGRKNDVSWLEAMCSCSMMSIIRINCIDQAAPLTEPCLERDERKLAEVPKMSRPFRDTQAILAH